jgi:NitT/TauT family transport system ATP-binding protein
MESAQGADILVSRVGKRYAPSSAKANIAVQDVTFRVEAGEFVSLVGASGCGKTTLIRLIGGLTRCTTGRIAIGGKVYKGVPPRLGFVFQDAALMPWRSARDNVAMGLNEVRRNMSRAERRGRVDDALALVGLSAYADYYPRQLSGGMQQRTGLARALVSSPDLLLMDEPFGALDAFTRVRLQEEMAGIVSKSRNTTVFVTHDVDEAVFLSDRIVVMSTSPGRVQEILSVDLPRPRLRRQDLLGNSRATELRDHVLGLVLTDREMNAGAKVG